MNREFSMVLFAAALTAAATACNTNDGPAPHPASAANESAPAETPATEPAKLAAEDLEHSSMAGAQEAPFVLRIETPDKPPEIGKVFRIEARIKSAHGLNAPTTITIALPPTATLKKGLEREELGTLASGDTTRVFEFETSEPLTSATPIKVIVDSKDPGGAFGAHAERVYPEPQKAQKPGNSRVPKPPVGRPGA